MLSSYKKKTQETSRGAWKDRAPDGLPKIHASSAHLLSATERIHKLQTLEFEHAGTGESELHNEWCDECQVAYRVKHTCIDKSKSKACIENRVVSIHI